MDNQKTVIILLCVIIAILLVCTAMFSLQILKKESHLTIENKNINAGDSLVVVLTDGDGNSLSNATINIKVMGENGAGIDENVTTDSKGNAKLKVEGDGKYSVECTFRGEGKYASSSLSDTIEIEKATTEVIGGDQSSTSKHSSKTAPDGSIYPEYGPEVDRYGVTREYAIANNMHYIEMRVDGDRPGEYVEVGGYVPYDPNAGCWHT